MVASDDSDSGYEYEYDDNSQEVRANLNYNIPVWKKRLSWLCFRPTIWKRTTANALCDI